LGLVRTQSREKNTAEPVQFSTPMALFTSFRQYFRLAYRIKSFGGTTRKVLRRTAGWALGDMSPSGSQS